MKTSVSLSVFEAPSSMPALFSGGTEKNIARIAELGYDGVDLFVRDPADPLTRQTIQLLRRNHLGIGAIMPAALARDGLFLSAADDAVRAEAIRRICEIIPLASEIGGMVSIGLVRGSRQPQDSPEAFEARFLESCEKLLKVAQPAGVVLLIEPINRYEINTINSVQEGMDFIRRSGLPLYLMNDTFHMNIEDVDIGKMLLESLPYTKHIHFLDSNRLAPSMGHLDMAHFYRILENAGYTGYLCLEALADKVDPDFCACCGAKFFSTMKQSKQEE